VHESVSCWLRGHGVKDPKPIHYLRKCYGSLAVGDHGVFVASKVFYIEDTVTLRQESLKTKDKNVAQRLFQARNEARQQPALNLQLARTYLAAKRSGGSE